MIKSFETTSTQAQTLLKTNKLYLDGRCYIGQLKAIAGNKLQYELTDQNHFQAPSLLKRIFVSLRAFSYTATFIPWLVAIALCYYHEMTINWSVSLIALFGVIALHSAVNILNDVGDHYKVIDLPSNFGGSGVIQKGWLSAIQLQLFSYFLIAISIAIAAWIIPQNVMLYQISLAGAVLALFYTLPKFGLKYIALGDITVLLTCGPLLTLGLAITSSNNFHMSFIFYGLFVGLNAVGILHANNMTDIHNDSSRGIYTVASLIGFDASKNYFYAIYFLAYLSLVVGYILGYLGVLATFIPFITILMLIPLCKKVANANSSENASIELIRFETPKIHLMQGLLLCLGIFIEKYLA